MVSFSEKAPSVKKTGLAELVVSFGEVLSICPSFRAAMTPWAFSKSLLRTDNGTNLYGRVIKREKKRENKHSMRASYGEVLAEASF